MVTKMKKVTEILKKFGLSADILKIEKINSGHINSTYKIIYSSQENYILQRINGNVFTKPEEIMSNIEGICRCLKGKVCCPEFKKHKNKNYIISENEMWRTYKYIENSVSYNTLEDTEKIYEFGRVTGEFHKLTENLNTDNFYNVIKNFHNTSLILENLIKLNQEKYKSEFNFFEKSLKYSKLLNKKHLTLKVTHNDVKCSNVLFDIKSGKGITLIDFDTVMPGLTVYDFGDGARSACVTDNRFNVEKFSAYCAGYFSCVKSGEAEDYFLALHGITAELAARYFHDFLISGNYFSDKTPNQKLERSRQLIVLAESILQNEKKIYQTICKAQIFN